MKNRNKSLLKLGRLLMVLLFVGGVMASCSKDKDNEDSGVNRSDFESIYFNIQNGDFSGRSLPGSNSNSLEITAVEGNSTVLAGGSNIIHITANDGARQVIVGVRDHGGFFSVPMVQQGSSTMVDLRMLIGQQATTNFTIAMAVSDGQGNYSTYEYLTVNMMDAGTGLLQVSLSWDKENDVDLHLIEPNGEHIYYGHRNSVNGGQLDVDSNAGCNIDNINNENIFYEDEAGVVIENGEYEVLVDLWSHCLITEDTNYTIVVYYGGDIIATTQGSNPSNGVLTVGDESHNSNLRSVMKFIIDGAPVNRIVGDRSLISAPKAYRFEVDNNNNVFQNFSVKK